MVSARARGVCAVPYSYKFFLQVDALRTVSTRQNKECLTEQWHPCSVTIGCTCTSTWCYFLETTVPSNSFCRLTVCRLFLRIRTGNPWQNQMSATVSTNCSDSSNSASMSLLNHSLRPFCCSCLCFPSTGKTPDVLVVNSLMQHSQPVPQ